jgi:hypothetical protein
LPLQIQGWMHQAGLSTWTDAVGNVHGILQSANATAPTLVLGSHYDTVLDAGCYDGTLGVITTIGAAKALVLSHLLPGSWTPPGALPHLRSLALRCAECCQGSCLACTACMHEDMLQRRRLR